MGLVGVGGEWYPAELGVPGTGMDDRFWGDMAAVVVVEEEVTVTPGVAGNKIFPGKAVIETIVDVAAERSASENENRTTRSVCFGPGFGFVCCRRS